jgi:hypothetical protein
VARRPVEGDGVVLRQVGRWVDEELPRLNRAILARDVPPGLLTEKVREVLIPVLPPVAGLTTAQAQRLVVLLGFVGASVARHYQEWTPGGNARPERAFDDLAVDQTPFLDYFAALAGHTGEGHYGRDSYASLVRWNVGTLRVRRGSELIATLPGVFDDGRIRSYTGTAGEENFFLLVKRSEAVELAVNDVLEPLGRDDAGLLTADAVDRVRLATDLIEVLRQLMLDFAALPPERSMPAEQFMDVFRQFAVHWTRDDIPPSGALDPEALKRDFLLGIALADYDRHVRRLFPALLDGERRCLDELMGRPTLPQQLLAGLGLEPGDLRVAAGAELNRLVGEHPALADWYRLLTTHARASGAHLMLSKKFLFKPQRQRDATGVGDQRLVSNRSGTTGMTESFLERMSRARREHPLAPLREAVYPRESGEKGTPAGVRSAASVSVALVG